MQASINSSNKSGAVGGTNLGASEWRTLKPNLGHFFSLFKTHLMSHAQYIWSSFSSFTDFLSSFSSLFVMSQTFTPGSGVNLNIMYIVHCRMIIVFYLVAFQFSVSGDVIASFICVRREWRDHIP